VLAPRAPPALAGPALLSGQQQQLLQLKHTGLLHGHQQRPWQPGVMCWLLCDVCHMKLSCIQPCKKHDSSQTETTA
jgi:hypothetical protein